MLGAKISCKRGRECTKTKYFLRDPIGRLNFPKADCFIFCHSQIESGVSLNTNKRQCKTENELKMAMDLINNHKHEVGLARRKIEEVKQSALTFPEDNLFVQIDSMDNYKEPFISN